TRICHRRTRIGRPAVLRGIRPGSAFSSSTNFGVSGCLGWMSFRWRTRFSGRTATSQIGQRSILFTATPFATGGRSQGELVFRNDADGGRTHAYMAPEESPDRNGLSPRTLSTARSKSVIDTV